MFVLSRFEWLVLAVALLLCPGFSFGAEPQADSASLFERLDRNKDGYLTSDELTSDEAKTRNWIAVDRDRDGRISRGEFGLVGIASTPPQPSAAAGATQGGAAAPRPPKPE
jgi:hypothetical protein